MNVLPIVCAAVAFWATATPDFTEVVYRGAHITGAIS